MYSDNNLQCALRTLGVDQRVTDRSHILKAYRSTIRKIRDGESSISIESVNNAKHTILKWLSAANAGHPTTDHRQPTVSTEYPTDTGATQAKPRGSDMHRTRVSLPPPVHHPPPPPLYQSPSYQLPCRSTERGPSHHRRSFMSSRLPPRAPAPAPAPRQVHRSFPTTPPRHVVDHVHESPIPTYPTTHPQRQHVTTLTNDSDNVVCWREMSLPMPTVYR